MEALVISRADEKMALAVHFHTQRRDGIGHMRAALYAFTNMFKVKKYPVGQPYQTQFGQSRSNSKR
jgi:hypothetical protein